MNTVPNTQLIKPYVEKMYWKNLSSSIVIMEMKLQLFVIYYF